MTWLILSLGALTVVGLKWIDQPRYRLDSGSSARNVSGARRYIALSMGVVALILLAVGGCTIAPADLTPGTDLQSYADSLCYGNQLVFQRMSSDYVRHVKTDWERQDPQTRCVTTRYLGSWKAGSNTYNYVFVYYYHSGDNSWGWQEEKRIEYDGKFVTEVKEYS